MPTCSFCKKQYKQPRGLTVFAFDGKSIYFCSSKCRRNTALKRDPRKTNWVKRKKKENKAQEQIEKRAEIQEVKKEVEKVEKKVEEIK
ncbi:MAG TPA: 50S ribosomal protein L24e [Candidatus Nanoarchaeia archaeon]|nr:50S ribosomal protein L24e [Candidatus Nanoarchaeia archaeon]